jgi:hypothetical protein
MHLQKGVNAAGRRVYVDKTLESASCRFLVLPATIVHRVPKSCVNRHYPTCQGRKAKASPTFRGIENEDPLLFVYVLVLIPKEGARARNRFG